MPCEYYTTLAIAILQSSVTEPHWYARARLAYIVILQALCVKKSVPFDERRIDLEELEDLAGVHVNSKNKCDWVYTRTVQEMRNELPEWPNAIRALDLFTDKLSGGMSNLISSNVLMSTLIVNYSFDTDVKTWHQLLEV